MCECPVAMKHWQRTQEHAVDDYDTFSASLRDKKPGGEELSTGPKRRGRDAAASRRGAVGKLEKSLLSLKKCPAKQRLES